jgi:hypothetical protein
VKTAPNNSSVALTKNEQQVLLWLLHHPLQRIRDVAIGLDLTESTTARVLQKLGPLVEHVTPRFRVNNRHSWYHLSEAAIRVLARKLGTDPVWLARAFHADERHLLRSLPRLPQMGILQDLVHSLVSSSPVALSDAGRQAEIRWGWQREYRVTFERRQRIMRCDADAVIVLRRRPSPPTRLSSIQAFFTLFVYLDLGKTCAMTDRATMVRKLRNLLLYRESRERQAYRSMFPLVMIVVESARQLELWQQAAQEAARQLRLGKPLAGVIGNLSAEQTKVERSSLWNMNWRHLTTNAYSRLQEMLVPMTARGVPPGIIAHRVVPQTGDSTSPGRTSRLVKGPYQMRMEALLHQPHKKPPRSIQQERESLALLSLAMSERYRQILLMLYTYPLLSIEELAVFSGLHPKTAYRYVLELSATFGYLTSFHRPRGLSEEHARPGRKKEEVRWALGVRGLRYLAASTGVSTRKLYQRAPGGRIDMREKTPIQRGVGQLYREWNHTAGTYQCVVAFHLLTELQQNHRIAWFETHFRCARHYQTNKKWHNFRPDAVLEYVVEEEEHTRRFHLWIEWDGGTMGSDALREKWRTYEIYLRSLEWRSYMSRGVQPLLLIIVPDLAQQNRVTRLVQEVFGNTTSLHVRITIQNLLHEHGAGAVIWTEVLPRPDHSHLSALFDEHLTNDVRAQL